MKSADSPALFPQPFARDADPRLVNPSLPETTADSGRVSILGGFPALNFTPLSSGGEPVNGVDMQTLFHMLSIVARAAEAGQIRPWDSSYAQQISGYPTGAVVSGSTPGVLYISLVDDNLADPVEDQKQTGTPRSWSTLSSSLGDADAALLHRPSRYLTSTYDDVDEAFFTREEARLLTSLTQQRQYARSAQQRARDRQVLCLTLQKIGATS